MWKIRTLLANCHNRLSVRLKIVSGALERASTQGRKQKRIDRFASQEGLISAMWQAWNNFSRTVIILSAQGTITAQGSYTHSQYENLSEEQLLYVCREASYARSIGRIRSLSNSHLEPTWGDATKINRIINEIMPSNRADLLTGFGLRSISLDLQVVRNACAHLSYDRIRDIEQIKTRYQATHYIHPSDALFWKEPSTGYEAWQVWVDELLASSAKATT